MPRLSLRYEVLRLSNSFASNHQIQEEFLDIRFLRRGYSKGKTHGGRIDTLGLDENGYPENGYPVINEYKRP